VAKRVSSPELIGRAEEVAQLTDAFERAASGEFGAVVVGGEAGVGKTRLVAELARHAVEHGGGVLTGDCVELAEGELPFAPLTGALRSLARELGPGEVETLPGRAELARLLPELGDDAEPPMSRSAADEGLAQARLFEVLLGLLERLGEDAPLVLAIEDLHWADRSTRDFLGFLVRNAGDARLLLVCTYRSEGLDRRHPLRPFLAELDRRPAVERLELAPLTRVEIGEVLAWILGHAPAEAIAAEVFERSDGNPFFAEELLAAAGNGREIPETLREALMVRVEPLSEHARVLLRTAAAVGRRASHPLLAKVSALPDPELDEALRETVAASILVGDAHTYAFRHALVREAVSADTLPGERTRLHVALAEALTENSALGEGTAGIVAGELAHHWREARRLPEALSSSLEAATAAEEGYAFAEAHDQLEHALEIWDQVPDAEERAGADLAGVLARAAENASLAHEPARAVALARRAVGLIDARADPMRAALLHERLGRYLWLDGEVEGAVRSCREAVELIPADPPTAGLARVLAAHGQILMLGGKPRESRQRCEQAIQVARKVGARAEEGHALNTLGVDVAAVGDRRGGIEFLAEAKQIAEELGWADGIGRAYVNLSETLDWDGRLRESAELAREGAKTMRRLGARSYGIFLGNDATHRLLRLGRLEEAAEELARVREAGPTGFSEADHHAAEAQLARIRSDLEAADQASRRARETLGPIRDAGHLGPTAAAEVEVHLACGRADDAVASFERALDEITGEDYALSVALLHARGICAYAELAEGARARLDSEEVARIERAAAAAIERFDAVLAPERYPEGGPLPSALAHRAVIEAEVSRLEGRSEAGLWRLAAEGWSELDEPLERAYAASREAEALLLAGERRKEAGDLLARAADTAREIGAASLLGQIEALARRARLPLERPASEDEEGTALTEARDRFGLTDRELEVLELLAEGRTNREIGEALFISRKTASVHVSRILGKLAVRSRVEAATTAQRLGLTGSGRFPAP
jgi:DNA-binding CsgD family transcriptional regulator